MEQHEWDAKQAAKTLFSTEAEGTDNIEIWDEYACCLVHSWASRMPQHAYVLDTAIVIPSPLAGGDQPICEGERYLVPNPSPLCVMRATMLLKLINLAM